MRRHVIFTIHPKDLSDMLRGEIKLGIPEGTKVVDIRINYQRDMIDLKLEHESFLEVEPGQLIPTRNFDMICTGQYAGFRVPEQFRRGVNELFSGADMAVMADAKSK